MGQTGQFGTGLGTLGGNLGMGLGAGSGLGLGQNKLGTGGGLGTGMGLGLSGGGTYTCTGVPARWRSALELPLSKSSIFVRFCNAVGVACC